MPESVFKIYDGKLVMSCATPVKARKTRIHRSKRSNVRGMSPRSANTLRNRLAQVGRSDLAAFVTVTYRYAVRDPLVWKGDLASLINVLTYYLDGCGGVWVLEFQERGEPHFHLIIWPETVGAFEDYDFTPLWEHLSVHWSNRTGDPSITFLTYGVRVQAVYDRNGLFEYLCAPKHPPPPDVDTGRPWGTFGRHLLDLDPVGEAEIDDADFNLIIRILRALYRKTHSGYQRKRFYRYTLHKPVRSKFTYRLNRRTSSALCNALNNGRIDGASLDAAQANYLNASSTQKRSILHYTASLLFEKLSNMGLALRVHETQPTTATIALEENGLQINVQAEAATMVATLAHTHVDHTRVYPIGDAALAAIASHIRSTFKVFCFQPENETQSKLNDNHTQNYEDKNQT